VAAIEISDAARSFKTPRGVVEAVRGIDLSVSAGETVALLGPNGAGKSTSIDLMLGLTAADRGSVSVFGRPPREAVDAGLVGAMLQTGQLIRDVSVRELATMLASLHSNPIDVDQVLRRTGIEGIADRPTQKLSGGEAQRGRFALALVSNPGLLVLDEPTVGMDVLSRRRFWQSIRGSAAGGRAILFATHYLDEADAHADRVVLIARGRIVAEGAPAAIRSRVGRRSISATLPRASVPAVPALRSLPGVAGAERRGDTVVLECSDSDAALRGLLRARPDARDIEVSNVALEDAFLELTASDGAA
jgi:ABC-2 type transport system ATP-binding protein